MELPKGFRRDLTSLGYEDLTSLGYEDLTSLGYEDLTSLGYEDGSVKTPDECRASDSAEERREYLVVLLVVFFLMSFHRSTVPFHCLLNSSH
jgi:hypothetical protein